MSKHVIITGTGRAGTTFLIELLTKLGIDTGFSDEDLKRKKDLTGRAGLEIHIERLISGDAPYVSKSPWFCDHIDQIINAPNLCIEHVIIPIRDIPAAALSRAHVHQMYLEDMCQDSGETESDRLQDQSALINTAPGGFWFANNVQEQETVLFHKIQSLLLALSKSYIPITLIHYPKLTTDAHYLYLKLKPIFNEIDLEEFLKLFRSTVKPHLVHSFTEKDR